MAVCLLIWFAEPALPTGAGAAEEAEFAYSRRTWQSADGLPEDLAKCVAQTADGYLWVGTSGGMVRFDGVRFLLFDHTTHPVMTDDSVFTALAGRDGSLWLGTEGGGLLRLRNGVFRKYGLKEGLTNGFVRSVYEDRRGVLWVGTDSGLFRMDGDRLTRVDGRDGIPKFNVLSIREDRRGRLLVGGWGMLVMDGDRREYYTSPESMADNSIRTLMESSDGAVWIGTISGVRRLPHGVDGNPFEQPRLATGVNVGVLMQSSDGRVWIGTYGHGLWVYERGRIVRKLTAPDGVPHNNVLALFEDSEKNIWVGSQGGLMRLSPSVATMVTTEDGIPQSINTIYQDRDGAILAAALNGAIYRVERGVLRPFALPAQAKGLRIRNAFRDSSGALWLGTDGQGVLRIASGKVLRLTMRDGLVNDFIRAFCEEPGGGIWIGTDGGLSVWRRGTLRNYGTDAGLVYPSIRFLHLARDGALYIGTDGGLSVFSQGAFRVLEFLELFRGVKTWAIHEDSSGTLWIGSNGNGLYRIRQGRVTRLTSREGLPSDKLQFIAEDSQGNFWMSTPIGVLSASRRDIEARMEGEGRPVAFRVYGMSEGLSTNQMSGGVQPAGVLTERGELWLPSTKGAVWMHSGARDVTPPPPPVLIEEAYADNRYVPAGGPLILPPGEGRLELHYTAVRLRSPERIRFKYWLEGFDHNWTDAGHRRVAYYTNVPPGNYRFHVLAYELNEPRNTSERTLEVHWRPHYYQTAWFIGLCAVAALGMVGFLYWLHIRNLRQRFAAVLEERSRLAREMHDTLIQGCVGLSALLEAAAHAQEVSPARAGMLLDRARQEARSAVEEARMAVWNLRHNLGKHATFTEAVARLVRQVEVETGIPIRFEPSGSAPALDAESERSLLLIIREALQNAVRHAAPRSLSVALRAEKSQLSVVVEDDGCGFDPAHAAQDAPHYGLIGMRERARKLGGDLELSSAPGKGTRVCVSLPLPKSRRRLFRGRSSAGQTTA